MTPGKAAGTGLTERAARLARQLDWIRGLRAAVALCAPLVLGDLLGVSSLGWAALGGFEATLADTGGAYRSRLNSLIMLSLGGASGLFLGALIGGRMAWALPVTMLWCFVWSYLAVLGQPFTSSNVLVQVIFICGIGAPASDWRAAGQMAILLLAGGGWAVVLSLFLWPLDPYRPARIAVAECYAELASFLGSVTDLAARSQQRTSLWHRLALHHQYRIRRAVERGWQAAATVRAEHFAETAEGRSLIVLLETADMLIARTVALAEHLEAKADGDYGFPPCGMTTISGLERLKRAEVWVAAVLKRRGSVSQAEAETEASELGALPQSLEGCISEMNASGGFLMAQIAGSASLLETATESAGQLRQGGPPRGETFLPGASAGHAGYVYARIGQLRQGWDLDLITANLTLSSLTLRHAARVALVCGLDVAIITMTHINHGYWLLMTSLIVLQPHVSGTLRRGLERIGGTVGGGIVAALLAMALHSPMATAAVLFPCALLALALMPVSYAAFAFFLTPAFVLAWMPYPGDWQLAMLRVGNTIAGALIAVTAMVVLFPTYERQRAATFMLRSVEADRRYLGELGSAWRSGLRSSQVLANARRGAGLAHNDTDESLQRLLAEAWPRKRGAARFASAFVTYLRRFAQGLTALAALEGESAWKRSDEVQERIALLDQRLAWLERRLHADGEPGIWPEQTLSRETSSRVLHHPGDRQLERLERQAGVLHRQVDALFEHGWLDAGPESKGQATGRQKPPSVHEKD